MSKNFFRIPSRSYLISQWSSLGSYAHWSTNHWHQPIVGQDYLKPIRHIPEPGKNAALLRRKAESMWDRQLTMSTTVTQLEHEQGLSHTNGHALSCIPCYFLSEKSLAKQMKKWLVPLLNNFCLTQKRQHGFFNALLTNNYDTENSDFPRTFRNESLTLSKPFHIKPIFSLAPPFCN